MRVMEYLHDHVLPGAGLEKARVNKKAAHKVAHELLESKTEALLMGKGSRDVMSILGASGYETRSSLELSDCVIQSRQMLRRLGTLD